jgi:thioredoxin 1
MQQARGGILLIDEAYGLNPGKGNWGYATEAVDTLVGQITDAEFKGNLIVIMAGYANQVNEMFQSVNPGLRSRFDKKRIEFPPWTAAQAADVTEQEIQKDGKTIAQSAKEELLACFSEMTKDASWASARDVFETILPTMYSKRAHRMAREKKKKKDEDNTASAFEDALSIPYVVSDVKEAFEHILGPRVPEIDTTPKLLSSLEEKGKLIVVDYFATWCGPCKKFAPLFAGMKQEFKTVSFYRVDVDKCTEAGEMYEIESIPTTLLYLNGDILMRISGADDRTLRKYLNEFIEVPYFFPHPSSCISAIITSSKRILLTFCFTERNHRIWYL